MAENPSVCLSLPSRPENVLVVRQTLTGVSDCLALDAIETNDLNTAVTEACNNVVQHAYEGGEGPMEVEVHVLAEAITVVVRDHGIGMHAYEVEEQLDDGRLPGIGLPVIHALCREVEFTEPAGGGTEARMEFATPRAVSLAPLPQEQQWGSFARREPSGAIELRIAPNALARAVLPRLLSTLAARAYFSINRISDVQLVAHALAANAANSIAGTHLDVGVTIAPRNLELRLGPLHTGHGESLAAAAAAADGVARVVQRLSGDAKSVQSDGDGSAEVLELRLVDPH